MRNNHKGYTLIELAVVVFIIGLMLAFAVPRIRDTLLGDALKTAARQLTGAVKELRSDAVREQVDYVIAFDLEHGVYWRYSADMTPEKKDEMKQQLFRFPDGVRIADMHHIGGAKKSEGEGQIRFFKKGYVQPTVIHLVKGNRYFTLVINPFLAGVKVYDRYVDFDDWTSG
ncbi:MAG: prepilin-type N-terminal cleavage/methylation domain-containing protein [Deltaproteobacteria bacterium]|nr:prepilin-type N-terminal cleavage/methylation domain-containing protein [Deltaproteobacteria bacterium]